MVESVFVSSLHLQGIEGSGANRLIVAEEGINKENWRKLRSLGLRLGISLTAFPQGGCPADPQERKDLLELVKQVLDFQPDEIWLDHFRFDGHWEAIMGQEIPSVHQSCEFCHGQDRVQVLSDLAREIMDRVGGRAKVGYFAVPFKDGEVPQLISGLGQDHTIIGRIFNMSSPMLYHRMIGKPVSYISEYVRYLADKTGKPILPIIQIKDMPDDLEDRMSEEDIAEAFHEAIKEPSLGVCFFWWNHALEKNKTGIISKLLS